MKKNINLFVIIVIVVLSIVVLFIYSNNPKQIIEELPEEDCLLGQKLINIEGDTIDISKINNNILILRYSILSCDICVDSIFTVLKSYENKIGIENIVLLSYYNNFRDFIITSRVNHLKYTTYFIPNNRLLTKYDKPDIPYFFILNSKFYINNVFYVYNVNEQMDSLRQYLKNVNLN